MNDKPKTINKERKYGWAAIASEKLERRIRAETNPQIRQILQQEQQELEDWLQELRNEK